MEYQHLGEVVRVKAMHNYSQHVCVPACACIFLFLLFSLLGLVDILVWEPKRYNKWSRNLRQDTEQSDMQGINSNCSTLGSQVKFHKLAIHCKFYWIVLQKVHFGNVEIDWHLQSMIVLSMISVELISHFTPAYK